MKRLFGMAACVSLLAITVARAGDDPSIQGETREAIQRTMFQHVMGSAVDGMYLVYDARSDQLLRLTFKEVHQGIMRKGGLYVSCADFFDEAGTQVDLDFIVAKKGDGYMVVDTIVHKVGKDAREYTLAKK